jgi:hypothetical protein
MTHQDHFASVSALNGEERSVATGPVTLELADLLRVSGGLPKGGWQAAGAEYIDGAVYVDAATTQLLPKGGW